MKDAARAADELATRIAPAGGLMNQS